MNIYYLAYYIWKDKMKQHIKNTLLLNLKRVFYNL